MPGICISGGSRMLKLQDIEAEGDAFAGALAHAASADTSAIVVFPSTWQAMGRSENRRRTVADDDWAIARPVRSPGISATPSGTPGQIACDPCGIVLPGSGGTPWEIVSLRDAFPNRIGAEPKQSDPPQRFRFHRQLLEVSLNHPSASREFPMSRVRGSHHETFA